MITVTISKKKLLELAACSGGKDLLNSICALQDTSDKRREKILGWRTSSAGYLEKE